jgi:hypothetical protein
VCQILEVDDEWNILKCTLHSRGIQKTSITLAKLVEFLVISIFHETKIQMVDMKAQVYSKFRKNKISKKIKSPNSMRNGRFDTTKCRKKLEKMGVLCTHSPKSPGPFPKLPKISKIIYFFKTRGNLALSRRRRAVGDQWSPTDCWSTLEALNRARLLLLFLIFFPPALHFLRK